MGRHFFFANGKKKDANSIRGHEIMDPHEPTIHQVANTLALTTSLLEQSHVKPITAEIVSEMIKGMQMLVATGGGGADGSKEAVQAWPFDLSTQMEAKEFVSNIHLVAQKRAQSALSSLLKGPRNQSWMTLMARITNNTIIEQVGGSKNGHYRAHVSEIISSLRVFLTHSKSLDVALLKSLYIKHCNVSMLSRIQSYESKPQAARIAVASEKEQVDSSIEFGFMHMATMVWNDVMLAMNRLIWSCFKGDHKHASLLYLDCFTEQDLKPLASIEMLVGSVLHSIEPGVFEDDTSSTPSTVIRDEVASEQGYYHDEEEQDDDKNEDDDDEDDDEDESNDKWWNLRTMKASMNPIPEPLVQRLYKNAFAMIERVCYGTDYENKQEFLVMCNLISLVLRPHNEALFRDCLCSLHMESLLAKQEHLTQDALYEYGFTEHEIQAHGKEFPQRKIVMTILCVVGFFEIKDLLDRNKIKRSQADQFVLSVVRPPSSFFSDAVLVYQAIQDKEAMIEMFYLVSEYLGYPLRALYERIKLDYGLKPHELIKAIATLEWDKPMQQQQQNEQEMIAFKKESLRPQYYAMIYDSEMDQSSVRTVAPQNAIFDVLHRCALEATKKHNTILDQSQRTYSNVKRMIEEAIYLKYCPDGYFKAAAQEIEQFNLLISTKKDASALIQNPGSLVIKSCFALVHAILFCASSDHTRSDFYQIPRVSLLLKHIYLVPLENPRLKDRLFGVWENGVMYSVLEYLCAHAQGSIQVDPLVFCFLVLKREKHDRQALDALRKYALTPVTNSEKHLECLTSQLILAIVDQQ